MSGSGDPALSVEALKVEYRTGGRAVRAVDNVDIAVRQGEFFTLLGPSGCGKTTSLRCIAGFEIPIGGRIRIGDETVFDTAGTYVPVHRRDIAMVFQSYAIWPHMTVAQNVMFPLEAMGVPAAEARERAGRALDMVGLAKQFERPATQLSGGQQQRVALARAIVKNARLLLLDEPLSNLDAQLREQMRSELSSLQDRLGTTTLYVTHDQEEALNLSDRIALMRDGRVVEIGAPRDLYLRPRRLFTARFIGQTELLPCRVVEQRGDGAAVETPIGRMVCAGARPGVTDRATLMIRPEHMAVVSPGGSTDNVAEGTIRAVAFLGRVVEYDVDFGAARMKVQTFSTRIHDIGEAIAVHLPPERCVLIDETEDSASMH